jgi:hypothetical protein
VIRFDPEMGKYVVILDGMLVGTFDTVEAANKHLRLLNN